MQAELDSAMKRIGELTMQVELLEAKTETFGPFGAAEVAAMSAATSPGTGLAYGLRRVCAAWGMARSSFYAMTSGQHAEQPPAKRRGPKPAISDQALLVAIEADLEASPWEGEGYRKVWARLRVCRDIRVARKRVLDTGLEQGRPRPQAQGGKLAAPTQLLADPRGQDSADIWMSPAKVALIQSAWNARTFTRFRRAWTTWSPRGMETYCMHGCLPTTVLRYAPRRVSAVPSPTLNTLTTVCRLLAPAFGFW